MSKLFELQKKISVPKNRFNKFGDFYYRSVEDIQVALKTTMPEGCHIIISDEVVNVGDYNYIKATASFFEDGALKHEVSGYAREEESKKKMDSPQLTGTASSYARKYALGGLLLLDDVADNDKTSGQVTEDDINELFDSEGVFEKIKQDILSCETDADLRKVWTTNNKNFKWFKSRDYQKFKQLEAIKNRAKEAFNE